MFALNVGTITKIWLTAYSESHLQLPVRHQTELFTAVLTDTQEDVVLGFLLYQSLVDTLLGTGMLALTHPIPAYRQ